jgi:hypothetical protein
MKPRLFHSTTEVLTAIEPRDARTFVGDRGRFAFAQLDEILAYAYALKNKSQIVFNIAQSRWGSATDAITYTYLIASDRQKFFDGLHTRENGIGGFIYEVDPESFYAVTHPSGAQEWVSEQTAEIITSPRFVTLEDVMTKGVQIFIVENPDYLPNFHRPEVDPIVILMRGYEEGTIGWFNKECGINPIEPPGPERRVAQFKQPERRPAAG